MLAVVNKIVAARTEEVGKSFKSTSIWAYVGMLLLGAQVALGIFYVFWTRNRDRQRHKHQAFWLG